MTYDQTIYCDGACRGNGQPGAVGGSGISIVLRSGQRKGLMRALPDHPTPTNQRAELSALILALEEAIAIRNNLRTEPSFSLTLKTDSRYAVDCMTVWINKWRDNNYTNTRGVQVINRDLIEDIDRLWDDVHGQGGSVAFVWIPREENSEADEAANQGCDLAVQNRQDQQYY
ncbi:ribonuclease HI, partial [Phenoliferia sp. Uapishka_3]